MSLNKGLRLIHRVCDSHRPAPAVALVRFFIAHIYITDFCYTVVSVCRFINYIAKTINLEIAQDLCSVMYVKTVYNISRCIVLNPPSAFGLCSPLVFQISN